MKIVCKVGCIPRVSAISALVSALENLKHRHMICMHMIQALEHAMAGCKSPFCRAISRIVVLMMHKQSLALSAAYGLLLLDAS